MWRRVAANRYHLRVSTIKDEPDRLKRASEEAADDARLVEEVRGGRAEEFDALATRYQRRVFAVAYRLLSNRDDAWDVAQDALLKAFRNLDQLEDPRRFGPWLMRIVTNLSLNYRRARKTASAVELDDAVEGASRLRTPDGELLGGPGVADAEKRDPELRLEIAAAMERLPEKQRMAFVLSCIERVPQKEIAGMLDCTVELVKWNVFQARKALRQSLEGCLKRDRD